MQWIFLGLLSAFFASLVAVFGKIGIMGIDSTLATTIRSGIMFLFLFVVSLSIGKLSLISTLEQRPLVFIALSGIAGALSWLCYFFALQLAPTAKVAVIDRMSMVFILVLGALFLGEHLTWKSVLGVLLATAGAIVIVL